MKNSGRQTSSIQVIKELAQLRDSAPGTLMALLDGRRKPFLRSEVNKKYLECSSPCGHRLVTEKPLTVVTKYPGPTTFRGSANSFYGRGVSFPICKMETMSMDNLLELKS